MNRCLLCFTLLLATTISGQITAEDSNPVGAKIIDFRLKDTTGREHALSDYEQKVVVIACLGTECPLVKLYAARLAKMAEKYKDRDVAFVGLNSNTQDSPVEITAFVRHHSIKFPVLKDLRNEVADQLGAVRTPEVFLLDENRVVRYWGRIDNQYGIGYSREKSTENYLRDAIDQLLAGKAIATPSVTSVGCLIGRVREADESSEVTYSNQIARIFQKHCVECHRPGEIGPFSLTNYDEVVGWSETIAEVIHDRRMPPWHADPKHGKFTNTRLMSDEEKQLVYKWVNSGSPRGDESMLPKPAKYLSGWRMKRKPDVVIPMRQPLKEEKERPFKVPAGGTVEYQYFVADPGFKEPKWVQAAEIIPGNRSVVHHAIVFFRTPAGNDEEGLGWLTAYVPGQSTFELAEHQARYIPAGAKLIFQMHYTPTGTPEEDVTKIGLVFADPKKVREEIITLAAINHDFEIPPHAKDFPVSASKSDFPKGAKLQAIAPHMHVRGRSFQVSLTQKNNKQVLLNVPHYDFNWQHAYALEDPIPLDQSSRIDCKAVFDNSANNLSNPEPAVTVRWGDQTWQEMMIAFLEVSIPVDHKSRRAVRVAEKPRLTKQQMAHAKKAAADLIRRFDKNRDGEVKRDETPDAFRVFAFGRFDLNHNDSITLDEAQRATTRSMIKKANGS